MARKTIPKKVKQELRPYIARLKKEKLPIEKVIVFGSYAKGTENPWSDIDVCIVSPRFTQPMRAMQYLWSKREKKYSIRIEPLGFHPNDFYDTYDTLIQEIKKTGIEYKGD